MCFGRQGSKLAERQPLKLGVGISDMTFVHAPGAVRQPGTVAAGLLPDLTDMQCDCLQQIESSCGHTYPSPLLRAPS